ncbi:MAG: ribonuclease E/G [Clostridiales bacterium]|nr:ribonuclease E/G [Clostridiales bacterium]
MRQVYINNTRKSIELMITEDKKIVEYYNLENKKNSSIEGNIYIGEIKSSLQGMQSFFVDIGEEKNCFLNLSDAEEKFDEQFGKPQIENIKNKEIYRIGDKVLLQVKKDAIDNKGAKLTTNISLTGRYFVLTPNSHFIAVTKKMKDRKIREEYVRIVQEYLPKEYGGIIRTNILEASDDEIKREIDELVLRWRKIESEYNTNKEGKIKLVYQEEDILYKTLKDIMNKDLDKIFVNNRKIEKDIKQLAQVLDEKYVDKVEYIKTNDLLEEYYLRKKLNKDIQKRVWLNCGGYLVINKTEALTAIDVNSGKYTGNKNFETTIFKVNKEAAIEVVRQMRLRNIGGIIIVDFIDMKNEQNKAELLEILKQEALKDRSKINIKGYTSLNLMEITRKKKNI